MGSETVSDPNYAVSIEREPVTYFVTRDELGQHEITVAHATRLANRWLVEEWRNTEDDSRLKDSASSSSRRVDSVLLREAFRYAHGERDFLPDDVLRFIATETPLAPVKQGERIVLIHRADVIER